MQPRRPVPSTLWPNQSGSETDLLDGADDLNLCRQGSRRARVRRISDTLKAPLKVATKLSADTQFCQAPTPQLAPWLKPPIVWVALGTSTGGTQARSGACALPAVCPGIVIVQHMPEAFTAAFAQRLNKVCDIQVRGSRGR